MRENVAKVIAVVIGAMALGVAAMFASRINAPPPEAAAATRPTSAPVVPAEPVDPDLVERGRVLFAEQGCERCHAVGGRGNPRSPLDRIGSARTREELHDWIVAAPTVNRALSRSVARAKESFAELDEETLDALTAWLSTLR